MPEIGPSGSEGGVARQRHPYPYRGRQTLKRGHQTRAALRRFRAHHSLVGKNRYRG